MYVVHIIVHIVHASHEVLSHWEGVGVMQNKGSINTVLITLPYSSVNKLGKLHTLYWRVPCMHLVKWEGKQGELDNTFQPSPYHHLDHEESSKLLFFYTYSFHPFKSCQQNKEKKKITQF